MRARAARSCWRASTVRAGPGPGAHRWPSAVEDVVAGVRFVRAHAPDLGVDPAGIGLIGGSSGGHLCLLAAIAPNAVEFSGGSPETAMVDASVAFALPLWPIADPLARYRYCLARRDDPPAAIRDPFFRPALLAEAQEAFFGDERSMELASTLAVWRRASSNGFRRSGWRIPSAMRT